MVTTEHVNFAAGGAIRIAGSQGELSIEGWERPEVQIEITRTLYRDNTPAEREHAKKHLESIVVKADQPSPNQLVLSTVFPKRSFPVSLWANYDVNLEYRIMVPRSSKLEIEQASGDLDIYDVAGDIKAHVRSGDIVVELPQPGVYNIDARTGLGTIFSDFDGSTRMPYLVGQRFAGTATGPTRQITLHTGVGGVSVLKMSVRVRKPGNQV